MERFRQVKPQRPKQARNTIRTLLELRKGQRFDSIMARYHLREAYGLVYDHHEIGYVLEEMSQCGAADVVGSNSGFTEYIIK